VQEALVRLAEGLQAIHTENRASDRGGQARVGARGIVFRALDGQPDHFHLQALLELRDRARGEDAEAARVREGNRQALLHQPLAHGLVIRRERQIVALQLGAGHFFAAPDAIHEFGGVAHPQGNFDLHRLREILRTERPNGRRSFRRQ
jgi:hypothetical protein